MMLRYSAKLEQEAQAIETAVNQVLNAGYRTADILRGSNANQQLVTTKEMGKQVHAALTAQINKKQSLHAV
jgi:3-isopropylmalate dehydrogenase